ncbi:hypothetical protein N7507_006586 [Penicillium longicatenatum]|nr:hypothetical protein N7507_006586 [Penicillium longicatenatum]
MSLIRTSGYVAPPIHRVHVAARRPGYQLAPYERIKLIELKSIRWSYRQIHDRYPSIPLSKIKSTCLKADQRGPTQETLPRSDQLKKLNDEDKEKIHKAIDDNPRVKYDDLLASVDYKIRRQAIWRLLREENRRKWLVLRRPVLTEEQAQKRLEWAFGVRDWDSAKWRTVFWSDESTIERGKGARREFTFNRPATQISLEISKQSIAIRMFWAAFSGGGRRTGLIPLFGDENSPRGGITRWVILKLYQRVLPTLIYGVNGAIFQQDNALVHISH